MFVCTVCTEVLDFGNGSCEVSACPCGHLFHFGCLERWFSLSKHRTCPQCREKAPAAKMIKRLYFQEGAGICTQNDDSIDSLKFKISELKEALNSENLKLRSVNADLKEKTTKLYETEVQLQSLKAFQDDAIKALANHKLLNEHLKAALLRNQELQTQLDEVRCYRLAVEGSPTKFVEEMSRHSCKRSECQNLLKICSVLKRETHKFSRLQQESIRKEELLVNKLKFANEKIKELESKLQACKNDSVISNEELQKQLEIMKSELESFRRKKKFLDDFSRGEDAVNVSVIGRVLNESPLPSDLSRRKKRKFSPPTLTTPLLYRNENSGSLVKGFDGLGGRKSVNNFTAKSRLLRTNTVSLKNTKGKSKFSRKKTT